MAVNILQQVATYNEANLALLQNSYAFISTSNKKFKDFNNNIPKNLGDTVNFSLPARFNTRNSLVISFESAVERVQSLTVDQQISTAYSFTAQQFEFNAKQYIQDFGRSAVAQIGSEIESYVGSMAETNTYRFYDGVTTPVSTYLQLAQALAFHRNFGSAKDNTKAYLSDLTFPQIVNSGLNQFTLDRGNKEAMSWEIGRFSNCDWYQSNLLTTHVAGTVGQAGSTLTVTGFTQNADGSYATITFSGAGTDSSAIKAYDKFVFNDGVSGHPNLRFLTFIGGQPSQSPVQFSAQFDAASSGGNVTVTLGTKAGALPLIAGVPNTTAFGITGPIEIGMTVSVMPSHRCGLIMSGMPLMLAMPPLPDEVPFPTSSVTDPETGCSLRSYYGSLFGQNQRGFVHDAIYGATMVPEYAMCVCLPV